LPNTTYSEQSYSIVSPNQMYSNDYNPTIRTPYPDVPYTEQVPKKKRDNIKTNTSEKKNFESEHGDDHVSEKQLPEP